MPSGQVVLMGDDRGSPIAGRGTVPILLKDNTTIYLQDVLHVPGLVKNLVALLKFTVQTSLDVYFSGKTCIITDPQSRGRVKATGTPVNDIYKLDFVSKLPLAASAYVTTTADVKQQTMLWHCRLGHANFGKIKSMVANTTNLYREPFLLKKVEKQFCEACVFGKHHRLPYSDSNPMRATKLLELVHSDLCGPMSTSTFGGAKYILTFIDDWSRYLVVYLIKLKSQTLACFREYVTYAQRQTGALLKILRSDNGGEYTSDAFVDYCKELGIARQYTVPYTSSQNPIAELTNRRLQETAKSMLKLAGLSRGYWGEAVATAAYVINRLPTSVYQGATPYERWTTHKPCINHLRIFGSPAYAHLAEDQRVKLDYKARKYVFIGYTEGIKGYKLYDPNSRTTTHARSVIFHKQFLLTSTAEQRATDERFEPTGTAMHGDPDTLTFGLTPRQQNVPSSSSGVTVEMVPSSHPPEIDREASIFPEDDEDTSGADSASVDQNNMQSDNDTYAWHEDDGMDDLDLDAIEEVPMSEETPPVQPEPAQVEELQPLRRSSRHHTSSPSEWLQPPLWPTSFLVQDGGTPLDQPEPQTYQEAVSHPTEGKQWTEGIASEYKSLIDNKTWELEDLPAGRKAVTCKWVFKRKLNPDGTVARFKARLVAKGYSQVKGLDYTETFSPVVRATSIRTLFAIAAQYDYKMEHMDVKTAFLNGTLEESIYMNQPEGFVDPKHPTKVCRLVKTIYGLKQSPRAWYKRIDSYLKRCGFAQSEADSNVYKMHDKSDVVYLALYVDDCIIVASSPVLMSKVKGFLTSEFDMSDLGKLTFFLGIQIVQNFSSHTIFIHQAQFVKQVLVRFRLEGAKPAATPMAAGDKLTLAQCPTTEQECQEMEKVPYRPAVGVCIYFRNWTRPELSHSVGITSQYLTNYGTAHWHAVQRILRYLKGTPRLGLLYKQRPQNLILTCFCDADWASDSDSRKSISTHCLMLGTNEFDATVIGWHNKKQQVVALSSTEAEYISTTTAAQDIIHVRELLASLDQPQNAPTLLLSDNQSAIALAQNPVMHARTKHIDIKHHFIRQVISEGQANLQYVPTEDNLADLLTKALARDKHEKFSKAMGLTTDPHAPEPNTVT